MLKLVPRYQIGGVLDTKAMVEDLKNNPRFFADGNYTKAGLKRVDAIKLIEKNQDKGLTYSINEDFTGFKIYNKDNLEVNPDSGEGMYVGQGKNPLYGTLNNEKAMKSEVSRILAGSQNYYTKLKPKQKEEVKAPESKKPEEIKSEAKVEISTVSKDPVSSKEIKGSNYTPVLLKPSNIIAEADKTNSVILSNVYGYGGGSTEVDVTEEKETELSPLGISLENTPDTEGTKIPEDWASYFSELNSNINKLYKSKYIDTDLVTPEVETKMSDFKNKLENEISLGAQGKEVSFTFGSADANRKAIENLSSDKIKSTANQLQITKVAENIINYLNSEKSRINKSPLPEDKKKEVLGEIDGLISSYRNKYDSAMSGNNANLFYDNHPEFSKDVYDYRPDSKTIELNPSVYRIYDTRFDNWLNSLFQVPSVKPENIPNTLYNNSKIRYYDATGKNFTYVPPSQVGPNTAWYKVKEEDPLEQWLTDFFQSLKKGGELKTKPMKLVQKHQSGNVITGGSKIIGYDFNGKPIYEEQANIQNKISSGLNNEPIFEEMVSIQPRNYVTGLELNNLEDSEPLASLPGKYNAFDRFNDWRKENKAYNESGQPEKSFDPNTYVGLNRQGISTPVGTVQYNDIAQLILMHKAKNNKLADIPAFQETFMPSGARNVQAARDVDSSILNEGRDRISTIRSTYRGSDPVLNMVSNAINASNRNKAEMSLISKRGEYRRNEEDRVNNELEQRRQQLAGDLVNSNLVSNKNRKAKFDADLMKAQEDVRRTSEYYNNLGSLFSSMQSRANTDANMYKQLYTKKAAMDAEYKQNLAAQDLSSLNIEYYNLKSKMNSTQDPTERASYQSRIDEISKERELIYSGVNVNKYKELNSTISQKEAELKNADPTDVQNIDRLNNEIKSLRNQLNDLSGSSFSDDIMKNYDYINQGVPLIRRTGSLVPRKI
jgi:hypothetical protein